ncbi:efflux transporter outer membrane subunit [Variovorax sp. J22P168]|uniref:efflux transporter outer membrane subunit n=1 Tax=Variovorax jilinensis TaxID=3053513 RepID=UPI002574993F|nr:efflux transporter outer membrane subunit [Variovorax sp. J22P168]MDM0015238.1 efflux transporter outer membrane subunit [Variovorax sp. J22P168]
MRNLQHVGLISAVALLLGGCSLQPLYQRPPAPVAARYPAVIGEPSQVATPARPSAADTGWRDFFTDERLQQLVQMALRNNRDLRIAVLNVATVQAEFHIQRSEQFPQVTVDAQGARSRTPVSLVQSGKPVVAQSVTASVSVAWEVDLFGRLQSLSDAAFEQYLASAHARQAAEILLVSQVAKQYFAVLSLDEQLDVTRNTFEASSGALELVQRRFEVGTASDLDLSQAQTIVEQARGNEAEQVRLLAAARNALVLLLGQPLPSTLPDPVPLAAQALRDDLPAGLPSDLLAQRPDILEAEAQLRSYNADIGAARAAFFPRIALTGSFGSASSALGGLFGAGSGAWSFVPAMVAPIFDAGANRANLDAAKSREAVAVARYEKVIQIAFREVADGLAARTAFNEQLIAAQRLADAQARRVHIAQVRYESGLDGYLNVLSAQTDFYNASLTLVMVRERRLESLADLYRSLGGGWVRDTGETRRVVGK